MEMQEKITVPNSAMAGFSCKRNRSLKYKMKIAAESFKKSRLLLLMLLFPLAYYIIFCYGPMYGVIIAFKDYNIFEGVAGSKWIGLNVFREIFKMSEFFRAVRNTLVINFLGLIVNFPAPIILAILLNEIRNDRFKKTMQTLLYLPHFISFVIVGGLFYQLLDKNTGYVNYLIKALGFAPIPFLTDKAWWVVTYLLVGVWKNMGWGAIIYLAAITGIDQQIYEAARIDGCSKMRMITRITLPCLKPTIVIMLILQLGNIVTISLEQPLAFTNAMVEEYSDVISTFVYRIGIQNARYNVATAVGLFQSVINIAMVLTANYIAKKIGEDGLW